MSDYRWVIVDGREKYRPVRPRHDRRSGLPCPQLIRDFDEPVQSMADGKFYTSKRALAASHRASGNPHGQDFIELGNEQPQAVAFEADAGKRRDDVRAAMRDVLTGNLPPEIAVIE